jgi:putative aldouronate transport system permease protein
MKLSTKRITDKAPDILIGIFVYVLMAVVVFVTIYPFWNILVISLNEATDAAKGKLLFWPRVFSLDSYRVVLRDSRLGMAFLVSVGRTVIGAPLACLFTILPAYVLSKRFIPGRKFLNMFFIFTMYFSGGVVPYFMVIKATGLYNNFMVYIIPGLFSVFNMILIRTYIEQLPPEMEESATIDGANEFVILARLIIPLSMPIIATVAIFVGINQWNSWYDSYVFTQNLNLQTIMALLVKILNQYQTTKQYMTDAEAMSRQMGSRNVTVTSNSVRMATTIIAVVPILCIYPFLQKYFTKGIMVGAIKA